MGSSVHGGYKLSNESLLERLSCYIFITNFLVHLSAKELWITCEQYGTVQDVYILKKLSKYGKPFAFARFNKNSAPIEPMHVNSKPKEHVYGFGNTPSFNKVVKGNEVQECHDTPVMVLERGSLNYRVDLVLMGCVKDFKTLLNMHNVCFSEGFNGGKNKLFRVVWIDVEGTPLEAWSHATFKGVASKWGELVYMDESNASNKYNMRLCVKTRVHHLIAESFKVILEGKVLVFRSNEVTGWVPDFREDDIAQFEDGSDNHSNSPEHVDNSRGRMGNSPNHVENFDVHVENSHEQLDNFHNHVENSSDHVKNSSIHMENSPVHLENSPDLSEDPFGLEKLILQSEKRTSVEHAASGSDPLFLPGFTPLNSNQSGNEAMENVAHEGISSFDTIECVHKNMSPGGSKHDNVLSLSKRLKPNTPIDALPKHLESTEPTKAHLSALWQVSGQRIRRHHQIEATSERASIREPKRRRTKISRSHTRRLRFALEALHFVSEDLAFYLQKILRFVFRRSCVLSSEDLAFCLQRSCVLRQKHCVLSTSKILRFVSETLRFVYKDFVFCLVSTAFCEKQFVAFCADCVLFKIIWDCVLSHLGLRFVKLKDITFCDNTNILWTLVQGIVHRCLQQDDIRNVAATDDSPVIPEHTTVETPMNMSPEKKAHFQAEKEAIHLILIRTGYEIYSTVDACQTAQEMWEAIKRLQQGESLNIQDVKTNLFWEFGKFTSHDEETMES
nr:hypothetical protein [Tanacetum cinerariifolium]